MDQSKDRRGGGLPAAVVTLNTSWTLSLVRPSWLLCATMCSSTVFCTGLTGCATTAPPLVNLMDRTNEHFDWQPGQLKEDLIAELGRRFELANHWRSVGNQQQLHACLGRIAFQLCHVRLCLELADVIARSLVASEPSAAHQRLLDLIQGEKATPATRTFEHRVDSSDGASVGEDEFARRIRQLASDPEWKSLSDEEKREHFRRVGLEHGTHEEK